MRKPRTDWGGFCRLIESTLREVPDFGPKVRVEGRLRASYEGLCHDNYLFEAGGRELVLRLGKRFDSLLTAKETRERMSREVETLRCLARCAFPFSVPELISTVKDERGVIIGMIESSVDGIPLSKFQHGVAGGSRLEMIADVVARVHRLPASQFGHLPLCDDSVSHVEEALAEVAAIAYEAWPIANVVRDWIRAHLAKRPAVVLHGDLLPQNVFWDFHESEGLSVIDWECARMGDPAYDLAIVTRGARQPQKESRGRERFLGRYNEISGAALPMSAVQIHELIMQLRWLGEAAEQEMAGKVEGHGPLHYAQNLGAMIRRFEGGKSRG
jgi:aminoglycoside phosphotransferase (APT) family kinase protein